MQHNSVLDMVNSVGQDKTFFKMLRKRFFERLAIKTLKACRAAQGLSVKDMANRLGVSETLMETMEEFDDSMWTLGDFQKYANILGMTADIVFSIKKQSRNS